MGSGTVTATQHIEFKHIGQSKSGHTEIWIVRSTTRGTILGRVAWYGSWQQYTFFPAQRTVWNQVCLQAINEFIEQEMAKR